MKNKTKIIALLLSLLMTLSFVMTACKKKDEEPRS